MLSRMFYIFLIRRSNPTYFLDCRFKGRISPKDVKILTCIDSLGRQRTANFIRPSSLTKIDDLVSQTRSRRRKKGEVYAFILKWRPDTEHRILKVGKTVDWTQRSSAYYLGNTPDSILFVRKTTDMPRTEKSLIGYCEKHFARAHGNEFFMVENTLSDEVLKQRLLASIHELI